MKTDFEIENEKELDRVYGAEVLLAVDSEPKGAKIYKDGKGFFAVLTQPGESGGDVSELANINEEQFNSILKENERNSDGYYDGEMVSFIQDIIIETNEKDY